jgi:hypothetical protein
VPPPPAALRSSGCKDDGVVSNEAALDHRAPAVYLFSAWPIFLGRGCGAEEDVVAAFRVDPIGLVDPLICDSRLCGRCGTGCELRRCPGR